jgi:hypothetical protein
MRGGDAIATDDLCGIDKARRLFFGLVSPAREDDLVVGEDGVGEDTVGEDELRSSRQMLSRRSPVESLRAIG